MASISLLHQVRYLFLLLCKIEAEENEQVSKRINDEDEKLV